MIPYNLIPQIISCQTRDKAYCRDVRLSKGGGKKSTLTRQSVGKKFPVSPRVVHHNFGFEAPSLLST